MGKVMAALLATSMLTSCANAPPTSKINRLPPCDTLSGSGTAPGRGVALVYAQRQVSQLYPDARGDLLGVGYRRIRIIGRSNDCRPDRIAGLATGLVTCTAKVRICGR